MSRINGYLGRRDILKLAGIAGVSLAATAGCGIIWKSNQASDRAQAQSQSVASNTALQKLMEGNKRFVEQKREYPDQSAARLKEIASGQHPFATILGCADSRVPAEIIFDQGMGDLFVVRVAGNVVNPEVIGSLEYATELLGTQLVVVLGHERCGAVTEAVKGDTPPGSINVVINDIKPVLARIKNKPGDLVDNAVIANVQMQIELLKKRSKMITDLIQKGKLKVVGARYDLDTGEVTIVS